MKPRLIVLVAGIISLVSGILLEFLITIFAGAIIEFHGLEATIIVIILIAGGLVVVGVSIMYELITRKYQNKHNS